MTLGSAVLLGVLTSASGIFAGLVRSKVAAVILGPALVGVGAEVNQLATLSSVPATSVTGPALISQLARARTDNDTPRLLRVFHTALTTSFLTALVAFPVAIGLGFLLLPPDWGANAWPLTAMAMTAFASLALTKAPAQALVAFGRLRAHTVASIVAGLVSAALVVTGTILFELPGQFAGAALAALVVVPIQWCALLRAVPEVPWSWKWAFDTEFLGETLRVGAATIVAAAGLQITLVVVRWALSRAGGSELNGYFQAAWAIGATYLGMVTAGLANFVFPRYAAASSTEELAKEIDEAVAFVLRVAPPVVLLAIALRDAALHVLYSSKFDPAAPVLGLMFAADLSKLVSWCQGGPLLMRGRTREYTINQLVAFSLLGGLSVLFIDTFGLTGIGYAYLLAYALHPTLTALTLRRACGVAIHWKRIALAVGLSALGLAALWIVGLSEWGRLFVALLAFIWAWRSGFLHACRNRWLQALRHIRRRNG